MTREAEIEAEAVRRQLEDARASRLSYLRSLRDGAGNLTTAQLTAALRLLAKEILPE